MIETLIVEFWIILIAWCLYVPRYIRRKIEEDELRKENENLKTALFYSKADLDNLTLYVKLYDKEQSKPKFFISHTLN